MSLHERSESFYESFDRKPGDHTVTHYCPGCGHGNVHKYIAEAADDMGIRDRVIFINPVGCSVFAYYYLDFGHVQAPHGRAPAVATAVKRAHPDSIVIVYQGDGDLGAIGGNEILQAANRGEEITVFFINNAIYGMTGGQMAPTTLLGQVTSTSPTGRDSHQAGYPIKVCELLNSLHAPAYLERCALGDAKHDMATRKAVRRALQYQMEGRGFSLVEVLSPCPTGWKMPPPASGKFILDTMTKTFPLGVVRQPDKDAPPPAERTGLRRRVQLDEIPSKLGLEASSVPAALAQAGAQAQPVDPRYSDARIKAAGFGGQGILFLGTLIAEAGMFAGRGVSWLPSYGPEMRGGTANCHVILSEHEVDSPLVTKISVLFAFNKPALDRFLPDVVEGGLVIYDTSLIPEPPAMPGVETIGLPATTIAEQVGSSRAANLVALGAYLGRTKVLPPAAIETALRSHHLKQEIIAMNMRALEEGMNYRG